jgi:hypothetical protein
MTIGHALLYLFLSGTGGGLVNALLVDRGLTLPKLDRLPDETTILRPGFIGNMLVGGVAAVIIGGLYGSLSMVDLSGTAAIHINFSALAAAGLTGVGGARVITQEVDKRYARETKRNLASAVKKRSGVKQVKWQAKLASTPCWTI